MGLCKKIASIVINFSLFFLIVTFSPGLPPKTTFPFEEFSVEDPKALSGFLSINERLDNAEKLFEGKLESPEHLLSRDDIIYASLRDNTVVKVKGDVIEVLTNFGKSCYNAKVDENIPCGRPLGMAFDTIGDNLIVMHSLLGVFQVDITTGAKKQLVSESDFIGDKNSRTCKTFNSVAVSQNGDLFFSHSSSEYDINAVALTVFPNPSGRLIHFTRKTGKTKVILDKIWFANGVALPNAENFVLVCETHSSRIMKVWLKGSKTGQAEVFIDGLPGAPDNLSYDLEGIWVSIATAADKENPMVPHLIANLPKTRKFVVRILELIKMPFEFINSVYPNQFTNFLTREIYSMDMIKFIIPARRTVIQLDWKGNVIQSFHGSDKTAGVITHAMKLHGHLYLGSVTSNYISRVKA